MSRQLFPFLFCLCLTVADQLPVLALPITAAPDGTGTIITPAGSQMDIRGGTQAGSNLFHSFSQFNVGAHQSANFLVNPTIQNILSRVVGNNPSYINGLLQVMGGHANLYLMNPAGIVFGAGAQLNVPGSFTATTANAIGFGCSPLSCDGWFPASGNISFANLASTPNSFAFLSAQSGAIFNAGRLAVLPEQNLTLLGGSVINTGTLSAPGGTITVMAVPGERLVKIQETGQLLSLDLPLATKDTLTANAPPFQAIALPQLLTGGELANATGVIVENGIVRLSGSNTAISTQTGSTTLSGQVTVAGIGTNQPGTIQVLGDRVALHSAHLNASGSQGGTILIGGDYQGQGSIPNAKSTLIDRHSTITADGISTPNLLKANGGKVIIWADETTHLSGQVSAQGGLEGGNGGFVETSGKSTLTITPEASVITAAPQGQLGTWLLDPIDLAVVPSGGTGTMNGNQNSAPDSTIDANVVVAALNGSNITLQASNSITINALIDASANLNPGNLTLQAPTAILNQLIRLKSGSILDGTASTVQVGAGGSVQNAVDVALSGATINFASATYTLSQQVNLPKNLTLNGTGGTTIRGSGSDRVFQVNSGATVTLNQLTIANGFTGEGGGIYNNGSLFLNNVAIANNRSIEKGGGIYNAGSLSLNSTTVNGNQSLQDGGGIYNAGTVTINNSSIISNQAQAKGGGIYNAGFLTLNNSNVVNNQASQAANGIFNTGSLTLNNSTVANHPVWDWTVGKNDIDQAKTSLPKQPSPNKETRTFPFQNEVLKKAFNHQLQVQSIQNFESPITQAQPADDHQDRESALSMPILNINSQLKGELAVAVVDEKFSNAYEQHFGFTTSQSVKLEQIQIKLKQLKQLRGINSALIYASFVPKGEDLTSKASALPRSDDQLQLILVRSTGEPIVKQIPVSRAEVVSQAKLFRLSVADSEDAHSFIPLARQMYGWLVAPLEADLQVAQISNLVFCLDEGLRTIPIAALMNQQQFLIEQYSVSVIPSAILANLEVSQPSISNILAMGAERFKTKESLPAVSLELQAISSQFSNPLIALNEAFTLENLLRSQQQHRPEMLHLATHAEFKSGAPENSYIQLWDTKLTLDQVKSLNWKAMNLTLLTLSACTTAVNSREAELGFAGLASVAGVRSSLGSLWRVSDVGTLVLMNEFYRQLKPSTILATTLQKAQLSLLRGETHIDHATMRSLQKNQLITTVVNKIQPTQFSHPFYWSAFTLVGNPW